jgi:hypothetical protein
MNKTEIDDYLRGARDCQRGNLYPDQSPAYYKGYSIQYEKEQVMTELGLREQGRRYQ